MYKGQSWESSGIPPECQDPVIFATPVNLLRVTSVLYPGQIRGRWYKPHGGFRFDGPDETGDIVVVAPMESTIYRASRGLDDGEIQYMFDFINSCGILYRQGICVICRHAFSELPNRYRRQLKAIQGLRLL